MSSSMIESILQVVVGLGLLNVWLVRSSWATSYRGGSAKTLKEEFAVYGLPGWFFYFIGALKIGSGLSLVVGLAVPQLVLPAAALVVALMLGALAMHIKVKDPLQKSMPAFLMLLMSAVIVAMNL